MRHHSSTVTTNSLTLKAQASGHQRHNSSRRKGSINNHHRNNSLNKDSNTINLQGHHLDSVKLLHQVQRDLSMATSNQCSSQASHPDLPLDSNNHLDFQLAFNNNHLSNMVSNNTLKARYLRQDTATKSLKATPIQMLMPS